MMYHDNLNKVLQSMGLNFNPNDASDQKLDCYYISNTDGSVRWFWTKKAQHPNFLKFYHQAGFRAKTIAMFYLLIFKFKCQKIFFKNKTITVFVTSKESVFHILDFTEAFVFTGTIGPNQKSTLFFQLKNGGSCFVKHAISFASRPLIEKEGAKLNQVKSIGIAKARIPKVINAHPDYIVLEDVSSNSHAVDSFNGKHYDFVQELQQKSLSETTSSDFFEKHSIENRLLALQKNPQKLPKGIIHKLILLAEMCKNEPVIETVFAHVDFTPWNSILDAENNLIVYDWELAAADFPKGFDQWHFTFQNEILVRQLPWREIRSVFEKQFETFPIGSPEKTNLSLRLYLLVNVLKQLEIFANQTQWHIQIYWLLNTWNDALSDALKTTVSHRELVMRDVFDFLSHQKYAGLKLPDEPYTSLTAFADIDLCISPKDFQMLALYLEKHSLVQKLILKKRNTVSTLQICFSDQFLLFIDGIHKFKRRDLEFETLDHALESVSLGKDGIKRTSELFTARFIGYFYGLNRQAVPKKYEDAIRILQQSKNTNDQKLFCYLTENVKKFNEISALISNSKPNQGMEKISNKIDYLSDVAQDLQSSKGIVLTFSGVDGAGKSTIIDHVLKLIEKKYRRKVVYLRHRPSLVPILSALKHGKQEAEKRSINSLPRQGGNKSFVSSLFRFLYYYMDYLIGQFYIYFKYTFRGTIVVYDRYYFDFINDSVRSNIVLPKSIVKWGYKLLLKPHLNFFLYADATTILKRKQELDRATIERLTQDYLSLFNELGKDSKKYYPIENIILEDTLKTIDEAIFKTLLASK